MSQNHITKFQTYSDEELLAVYDQAETLSEDAQQALHQVLEEFGGLEAVRTRVAETQDWQRTLLAVEEQLKDLLAIGVAPADLPTHLDPDVMAQPEAQHILETVLAEHTLDEKDRETKPNTVVLGLAGALIGGGVGGLTNGIVLLFNNGDFMLLVLAVSALISFVIIHFLTGKTKNKVVGAMTVLAVGLSFVLAIVIYESFG